MNDNLKIIPSERPNRFYDLGMKLIEDTIDSYLDAVEKKDAPRAAEELAYMQNDYVAEVLYMMTKLKDINWERRINDEIIRRGNKEKRKSENCD